jgi:RNA polymerase sigma factor (sigma-70 family)
MTDMRDDAGIIRAARRDPAAFAEIFDRHFESVHAFARRRVGADLADEIASETFVRAFDLRASYDLGVRDARPWLLGIAANLMRRHWRTEKRRLAAYARLPREDGLDVPVADGAALAALLDGLRKEERDVLFLHALADLSYEEIAAALGIPVGTVRSRLSRARRRLREALAPAPSPREIEESANA